MDLARKRRTGESGADPFRKVEASCPEMVLGTLMERELNEQPEILASQAGRYLEDLSVLSSRQCSLIVLVARGSSDNAALYARYLIEVALGIPVVLAAPSVFTRYGATVNYPPCLAVGISQSGAAPDVAEVLEGIRGQGHMTLGITNTPGSRITHAAEATLLLSAGPENSVAATKTYSASLLAMYQLVRALGGNLPEPIAPDKNWMARCAETANAAVPPVIRSNRLFALARGYSFATAHETALKLMECALLPCIAYSSADFEHGPKAVATGGSAAITFVDVPMGLSQQGCQVVRAPSAPVPEPLRPIWEIVFSQMLSLNLARARGYDPDNPPGLHKVTRTR